MKTAQDFIDEADISFRYSTIPKVEKRMVEKIAWGEGVEVKDDSSNGQ